MADSAFRQHSVELPHPPREALEAVGRAAEDWGGEWQPSINGGRLTLPVVAGLRRGVLTGRVSISKSGQGAQVTFTEEASEFHVQRTGVVILVLGALGGLIVTLWPFYPALLALAPAAVVIAFAAWLMVASRLRVSGIEEFLSSLDDRHDSGPASQDH